MPESVLLCWLLQALAHLKTHPGRVHRVERGLQEPVVSCALAPLLTLFPDHASEKLDMDHAGKPWRFCPLAIFGWLCWPLPALLAHASRAPFCCHMVIAHQYLAVRSCVSSCFASTSRSPSVGFTGVSVATVSSSISGLSPLSTSVPWPHASSLADSSVTVRRSSKACFQLPCLVLCWTLCRWLSWL